MVTKNDQLRLLPCISMQYTVKLGIKELLNKEQIGFKELFTDYQPFYTINLLLNKELWQSSKILIGHQKEGIDWQKMFPSSQKNG